MPYNKLKGVGHMQTIHIIPSNHHQNLKEILLETNHHLLNTQVLDFDIAFKLDHDATLLELETYSIIKSLDLTVLKDVITFPKITELVITMIKELNLYEVSLDSLPNSTQLDQDILKCIESIFHLIQKPSISPNTEYIAYDQGLNHAQVSFLNAHNIEIKILPTTAPTEVRFHNALNPRQELEGAIQDIMNRNLVNVSFVIPNLQSLIPLIETSFARYGIHLQLEDRSVSIAKTQYLSLFNYALKPSNEAILKILETNALNLKTHRDLHFLYSGGVDEDITNRSQEDNDLLNTYLVRLETPDFHTKMSESYAVLFETQKHNLKPLKNLIESSGKHMSLDTVEIFIDLIDSISTPSYTHESLSFFDLNDFHIIPQDHVYALMLSAQNYPAVSSNSGIFDESYRKRIQNYPSLESRTRHTLINKGIFMNKSKSLTLSYSISNYEGKPQEPSFAIESFAHQFDVQATPWPLVEKDYRKNQEKQLSPNIAQKLFTKDGVIYTSVSALQLYTQNPYQYFIERGLRLREPEYPMFDARNLGTLNHKVMEDFHNGQEHIWESDFYSIFETMIIDRDRELMGRNIDIISKSQSASNFNTEKVEGYFKEYEIFKNIKITGIIDRVDMSDRHLMIVDYKSSAQSLSVPKVKAGEQLQLLSYGIVASQLYGKELFAVYNYGFNETNINTFTYNYSSAKGVFKETTPIEELYSKTKRYEGWVFTGLNDLLTSAEYHAGIRDLKSGLAVSPTPYNYETVKSALQTIYESLYKHITDGVIDINKIEITNQDDINFKEEI